MVTVCKWCGEKVSGEYCRWCGTWRETKSVKCVACDGTGYAGPDGHTCTLCDGSGYREVYAR